MRPTSTPSSGRRRRISLASASSALRALAVAQRHVRGPELDAASGRRATGARRSGTGRSCSASVSGGAPLPAAVAEQRAGRGGERERARRVVRRAGRPRRGSCASRASCLRPGWSSRERGDQRALADGDAHGSPWRRRRSAVAAASARIASARSSSPSRMAAAPCSEQRRRPARRLVGRQLCERRLGVALASARRRRRTAPRARGRSRAAPTPIPSSARPAPRSAASSQRSASSGRPRSAWTQAPSDRDGGMPLEPRPRRSGRASPRRPRPGRCRGRGSAIELRIRPARVAVARPRARGASADSGSPCASYQSAARLVQRRDELRLVVLELAAQQVARRGGGSGTSSRVPVERDEEEVRASRSPRARAPSPCSSSTASQSGAAHLLEHRGAAQEAQYAPATARTGTPSGGSRRGSGRRRRWRTGAVGRASSRAPAQRGGARRPSPRFARTSSAVSGFVEVGAGGAEQQLRLAAAQREIVAPRARAAARRHAARRRPARQHAPGEDDHRLGRDVGSARPRPTRPRSTRAGRRRRARARTGSRDASAVSRGRAVPRPSRRGVGASSAAVGVDGRDAVERGGDVPSRKNGSLSRSSSETHANGRASRAAHWREQRRLAVAGRARRAARRNGARARSRLTSAVRETAPAAAAGRGASTRSRAKGPSRAPAISSSGRVSSSGATIPLRDRSAEATAGLWSSMPGGGMQRHPTPFDGSDTGRAPANEYRPRAAAWKRWKTPQFAVNARPPGPRATPHDGWYPPGRARPAAAMRYSREGSG